MQTLSQKIYDIYPGEAMTIKFPDNFNLEYKHYSGEIKSFICNELHLWYWDDDDHRCLDWYFHSEESNDWVCKLISLTEESLNKVNEYLRTH